MDKNKIREALASVLEDMKCKALEMNMNGVAVACCLPEGESVDWIGDMKVVETPYNPDGGDRGWNLVAIAWAKAGEVIASGADSGDSTRKCMLGEFNFMGGAYDEYKGCKLAFAFSGGLSEDDLYVAKYGIEQLKALL